MEKIILIRHGDHKNDILTDKGRIEINNLANKLDFLTEKNKIIKIFSSNYTRTIMSAELIKQLYELDDIIKIDVMGENDFEEEKIYDFIKTKANQIEIVILVTHAQHVRFFPGYFSIAEWQKMNQLDKIETGEAVIIDCLKQEISVLKKII